jgi:Domain of unknown function (DUF5667)
MGRPNQTHDRLDALLDGRPGEVTDDLAPLLAAAEALRGELAEFELDPEVVDRHLEQALDRPATVVPLPVREDRGGGLRRQLVAVGLAAALVLVPATAASAASSSALPGQPLYPVKIAFEQFRLATVQWSPTLEAQERAKLAARRLHELQRLVDLRMYQEVPPAIRALDKAVEVAKAAVAEAAEEEGADPKLVDAFNKLTRVAVEQHRELVALKQMGSELPAAVTLAVAGSPAALQPTLPTVPPALQSAVTTLTISPPQSAVTTGAPVTQPEPSVTTGLPATQPEPSASTSTSTTEPSTSTTTTSPPIESTTTVAPDGGTAGSDDQGNPAGAGSGGNSGRAGSEGTPPSSGP